MVSAFFCKIVHCLTLFLFLWKFRIRFVLFHAAPALCKFADSDELISASGKFRNDCLGGSGGRFIQIVHQYDISILYMVQYGFLGTCGIPRFQSKVSMDQMMEGIPTHDLMLELVAPPGGRITTGFIPITFLTARLVLETCF